MSAIGLPLRPPAVGQDLLLRRRRYHVAGVDDFCGDPARAGTMQWMLFLVRTNREYLATLYHFKDGRTVLIDGRKHWPIAPEEYERARREGDRLTARANPCGALPTVVGLGRLLEVAVRADGRRSRLAPRGERWLGWSLATRDLVVLRPTSGGATAAGCAAAVAGHARFHGAPPSGTRPMEWPEPRRPLRSLGLLESVTYSAASIHSPSKGGNAWIHHFGDRGERGHGPVRSGERSAYPERLMPRLDQDGSGSWFITRRPANAYTVSDWIIA